MNRREALLGGLGCVAASLGACSFSDLYFPRPGYRLSRPGAVLEWPCRLGPGGLVLVRGRVSGTGGRGDADFILDTGAPVSVLIDGPRSAGLGLDSSGARKLGPADDAAAPVGVIRSGFEIAFDGLTLSGLSVVVVPQASLPCADRIAAVDFQGVIGADLMRRFVVEVDSAARVVRLFEPAAWRVPPGAAIVPLTFEGGHPFALADAQVGGQTLRALRLHVDTGQNHDLSLVLGRRPGLDERLAREARDVCFVNGRRTVWRADPVQLVLGGFAVTEVRTSLHPAADRHHTTGRDGSLGIGVLGRYRFAVDYPGSRIVLAPPAA